MQERIATLSLDQPLFLEELMAWMDGGTVTLRLIDSRNQAFNVEFVQRMSLTKIPPHSVPGSFLFENEEVLIRSASERQLLQALR